jgi:CheY-like chemotaxis protein
MKNDRHTPRLLIVDDEPDIRTSLKERLEFNNYEVSTASNGLEALNLANSRKPDIIVTDIRMPVMDGLEMINALRQKEDTKHIPVIIMTAFDLELWDKVNSIDFYECVNKPFEMAALIGIIEKILDSIRVASR